MSAVESRATRFHEIGEPLDVLTEEQTQIPDPGAGMIRVRVAATGLNPADWELCRGFMPGALPRGIGVDVSGTVDAIGDGVADVAVGDLVFGSSDFAAQPSAGAADFAILNLWFAVPTGLDAVHAAVLPMVLQTAHWTLDLMNVKSGETVLIHGAGGMVGYAAVQLALRRGACVIATAGPTFARDLEEFGAIVTPYGEGMVERVRSLADRPIDHVLDASRPNAGRSRSSSASGSSGSSPIAASEDASYPISLWPPPARSSPSASCTTTPTSISSRRSPDRPGPVPGRPGQWVVPTGTLD